jgi:diguanylate cyclase (GGDEF)-like protein/PAS domain S-box-containing protein
MPRRSLTAPDDVARLRQMLGMIDEALVATDLAGRVVEWNPAATRLYGWTSAEATGERLDEVLSPEVGPTDAALIGGCGLAGQVWSGRLRVRHRDGAAVMVSVEQVPLRDSAGRVTGTVHVSTKLSGSDASTSDWFALLRADGGVPYLSAAMYAALGLPVGLDLLLVTLVHPEDRDTLRQLLRPTAERADAVSLRLRAADKQYRTFHFRINDLIDAGGLLLTGHPIDDELAAAAGDGVRLDVIEERAKARMGALEALTDPLTGLPNGVLLVERLQGMLDGLGDGAPAIGVLYVDVDGFTTINESLGEQAGDELLVVLARRLRRALRADETVGRFGNDEFVLCAAVDDGRSAAAIARRIAGVLSAPAAIDGHEIKPTVSIGVAITDDPQRAPDSLLREADAAMHRAQDGGRAQLAVLDRERQPLAM